jgi:MFS family permease
LFVCAAIAGAFGGLLAYAFLQMDGVAGYPGWRWVYIMEGILSLLIGPVIWFGLPNDPNNAWFLTTEDKKIMQMRAIQRAQYMGGEEFSWEEIRIAFKDPKVYIRSVDVQYRSRIQYLTSTNLAVSSNLCRIFCFTALAPFSHPSLSPWAFRASRLNI